MPLPAPRTWLNGEEPANIPSADDLNLDWRDSFDFLLGYSRPFIYVAQTTTQVMTAGTFHAFSWQQEIIKRGGMTHAANSATIEVPYTGQYVGYCVIGMGAFSTTGTRVAVIPTINGTGAARFDMGPQIAASGLELHGSLTLNMEAGDDLQVTVRNSVGTVSTVVTDLNKSKLVVWYAGDYE